MRVFLALLAACTAKGTVVSGDTATGPTTDDSTTQGLPADCPAERPSALVAEQTLEGSGSSQLGSALAAGAGGWLVGALAARGYDGEAIWWSDGGEVSLRGSAASSAGSAAAVGDLDGDGLEERIVGARSEEVRGLAAGAVWVVAGSVPLDADTDLDAVGTRLDGASDASWTGHAVALAGDLDADGLADLVIGAPLHGSDDRPELGGVHRVTGGVVAGALDDVAPLLPGDPQTDSGWTLAALDDGDGDGVGDLLVGAPYADPARAYVLGDRPGTTVEESASAILIAATAGSTLGFGLEGASDLTGDGLADIAIGDPAKGRVFVHPAAVSGEVPMTDAVAAITGPDPDDAFGYNIVSGDFDCDGMADLAVGSVGANGGLGRVTVMWGPFAGELEGASLGPIAEGDATSGLLGYALAAGDVDADGLTDLAASAPTGADLAGLVLVF
jgi:hypothetical protein